MIVRCEPVVRCPLCAGQRLHRLLDVFDYESQTGRYAIDECVACGIAFTNPQPIEEDLPKLYAARDTTDFPQHTSRLADRLRDVVIDRRLRGDLAFLRNAGDSGGEWRMLDFGCGDGSLTRGILRTMAAAGRSARVSAVDFHEAAPKALAGLTAVDYQGHAEWNGSDERYDAIFLKHVLEHHAAPVDILQRLRARLKPAGRIFIEVPNRRSAWARIFGARWAAYYVPRHLFHFDMATLERVLGRAGLRCARLAGGHTPLLARSLAYATGREFVALGAIGLGLLPLQIAVDAACRTSSTIRATAVADD